MTRLLEGSRFEGKALAQRAEVFWFRKEGRRFAVCWTRQGEVDQEFESVPCQIMGRDGEERPAGPAGVRLEEKPQYVFTS
jgi:hypothetical protein